MLHVVDPTMARKAKPAPGPAPKPGRKPLLIQVRGNREWGEWAEKIARADSRPLSGVVEQALKMYARHVGVHDPMPER